MAVRLEETTSGCTAFGEVLPLSNEFSVLNELPVSFWRQMTCLEASVFARTQPDHVRSQGVTHL